MIVQGSRNDASKQSWQGMSFRDAVDLRVCRQNLVIFELSVLTWARLTGYDLAE